MVRNRLIQPLQQLDTVIQQNASASEEMASMSEELNSQAEMMQNNVNFFQLDVSAERIESLPVAPAKVRQKSKQIKAESAAKDGFTEKDGFQEF